MCCQQPLKALLQQSPAYREPVWLTAPPMDKLQYYLVSPYRAGGAGLLQEQHNIDPPSTAKLDAAQPRYRPVPSSYLQQHTHKHTQRQQQEVTQSDCGGGGVTDLTPPYSGS